MDESQEAFEETPATHPDKPRQETLLKLLEKLDELEARVDKLMEG